MGEVQQYPEMEIVPDSDSLGLAWALKLHFNGDVIAGSSWMSLTRDAS